ncbi:MAG TPA: MFS transporter [Anaerolineae bacterium]|nr:MFS transporter [Anaerolineae bacterium]
MHSHTNAGFIQVLRNERFRKLWLGQATSAIGNYFYLLAVPIMINQVTGSIWAVGLVQFFIFALPGLLFSLPAGVLVDRWDRRHVMIVTDLLRAVLVLGGLLVHDSATTWTLWVSGFIASAAGSFFSSAQRALIPALVKEDELLAANGLSEVTSTIAWVIGPALAGFTIAWLGTGTAFIVDSATFLISALAVWRIGALPASRPQAGHERTWRALREETLEGLRFVAGNPVVRNVIFGLATVQLGVGATNVLFVPLLANLYGAGPEGIGLVDSVQGLGMALGGLAVGRMASRLPKPLICTLGFMLSGLMLGMTGIAPSFVFILVFAFILGVGYTPAMAVIPTLLQQATPDHTRGRVFGVMSLLAFAAVSLSAALAALAATLLGIRYVYLVCGALWAIGGLIFIKVKEPRPTPPVAVEARGIATLSEG